MERIHLKQLAVWRESTAKARARVLLIHGLGEHSERHRNTIDFLKQNSLEVVRFDLRGAGESGGRRQWISTFQDYVQDAASVLSWVDNELPKVPLYLLGHSLGGAIATHFAAQYGRFLKGIILSAPAYLTGRGISKAKIVVGRLVRPLLPTLRVPSLDMSGLSRDPAVGEAYRKDPLSCHYSTVQQGDEILNAIARVPEEIKKVTVPLALFHGSHDPLIKLEGSFELLQAAGSKDKELHILPGFYHEPHNDLGKEEYLAQVVRWIQKRI